MRRDERQGPRPEVEFPFPRLHLAGESTIQNVGVKTFSEQREKNGRISKPPPSTAPPNQTTASDSLLGSGDQSRGSRQELRKPSVLGRLANAAAWFHVQKTFARRAPTPSPAARL